MIETERLYFRDLRIEDVDFLMTMHGNCEVMRYLTNGVPDTRETVEQRVRDLYLSGNPRFCGNYGFKIVHRKSDGLPIGKMGILHQRDILGRCEDEIGWWLAPGYTGAGYASEGAAALHDHALKRMNLRRIGAFMHPQNVASIRVAQKIGMKCEGEFCWDDDPAFPALLYMVHVDGLVKLGRGSTSSP